MTLYNIYSLTTDSGYPAGMDQEFFFSQCLFTNKLLYSYICKLRKGILFLQNDM